MRLALLPHHAVVRQNNETTKVRVVYTASARSSGPSLNSCLFTGLKFILVRFCTHRFALIARLFSWFQSSRGADILVGG